jgi:hypothetical protein
MLPLIPLCKATFEYFVRPVRLRMIPVFSLP